MELIKKLINPDTVLLYADEPHVRSYQILRATWSEIGRQKQVPMYGHHAHVSVFEVVNLLDGDTVLHRAAAANATTFLGFLKILKSRYSDKLIVLRLDNARIHHAKMEISCAKRGIGFISSFCPRIPRS